MKPMPGKSVMLLLLLIAAISPSCYTQQPAVLSNEPVHTTSNETPAGTLAVEVLSYVNKYRESKGLSPLTTNAIIAGQAEQHSMNMASKKVPFSHDGFENRIQNISRKMGTVQRSAENVALGKLTAKEVVDIWLKSAGHRKNIEGNFKQTGIGLATAKDGTIYFTQIFTL
jgi:uncharacterized protein YkwD